MGTKYKFEDKSYTEIKPTAKNQGSATGWITEKSHTLRKTATAMRNYARDYEPTKTKLKTTATDAKAMGLSTSDTVRWVQTNFTKKGKAAVQNEKLKSLKK